MSSFRTAVLLAAGRGTRLGRLTASTPKPMLPVAGTPLIEHIARGLADAGIMRIVIVVGYLGDQIVEWGAGFARQLPHMTVVAIAQDRLSGTAAALLAARDIVKGDDSFIFGWGDVLMDPANYRRFMARTETRDFDLLLAVNRTKDPWRGAAVYLSADMRVTRLVEKPPAGASATNWNNSGLFAANQLIFDYAARLEPSARGELELPQAIAAMIADHRVVRAIDVRGFWSDIGTPADLEAARMRLRSSRVAR